MVPVSRKYLLTLAICLCVAVIWFAISGQSVIEIQLHDTYLVTDATSLALLGVTSLIFIFFVVRAFRQKFRAVHVNLVVMGGLIFSVILLYRIIALEQGYLQTLYTSGMDASMRYDSVQRMISITWAGFILLSAISIMLAVRTAKLWRKHHSNLG